MQSTSKLVQNTTHTITGVFDGNAINEMEESSSSSEEAFVTDALKSRGTYDSMVDSMMKNQSIMSLDPALRRTVTHLEDETPRKSNGTSEILSSGISDEEDFTEHERATQKQQVQHFAAAFKKGGYKPGYNRMATTRKTFGNLDSFSPVNRESTAKRTFGKQMRKSRTSVARKSKQEAVARGEPLI